MRNRCFLLLVAIYTILTSVCFTKVSDVRELKLKGKVKSYVVYEYDVIRDSTPYLKFQINQHGHTEYDKDGSVIQFEKYHPEILLQSKDVWRYDKEGQPIGPDLYRWLFAQSYTSSPSHSPIIVDSLGHPIYGHELHKSKSTISYDNEGNKTETKYFYGRPDTTTLNDVHKSKYDRRGHLVEFKGSANDVTINYIYNRNGKIEKKNKVNIYHSEKGDFSEKEVSLYNKKGELVETDYYDKDTFLTLRKIYINGKKGTYITNQYDGSNKLIDKIIWKYIYDKMGNWTIATIYDNDTLRHISRREFEYYK